MNGYEDNNTLLPTKEQRFKQEDGFEIVLRTCEVDPVGFISTDQVLGLINEAAGEGRVLLIDCEKHGSEMIKNIPIEEARNSFNTKDLYSKAMALWKESIRQDIIERRKGQHDFTNKSDAEVNEIIEREIEATIDGQEPKTINEKLSGFEAKLVTARALEIVAEKRAIQFQSLDLGAIIDAARNTNVPVYFAVNNEAMYSYMFHGTARDIDQVKIVSTIYDKSGKVIKTPAEAAAHSEYLRFTTDEYLGGIIGKITPWIEEGYSAGEIAETLYPGNAGKMLPIIDYVIKNPVLNIDELASSYLSVPVNSLGLANTIQDIISKHTDPNSNLTYEEIAEILNDNNKKARRPFRMTARIVEDFIANYLNQ